uniref:ABC-F family ATP-binding cassette domain-containing protein n=1 Tax=uncultured Sphingomonas sp. TaxID=158754 RepID=UPI0035CAE141
MSYHLRLYMSSISLTNLAYTTIDGRVLLSRLDLCFNREKVGLVGRNGTGKTTLLRILAGQLKPFEGRLTIDGSVHLMPQEVRAEDGATIATLFGITDALAILRRAEAGEATLDDLAQAEWTLEDRLREALIRVNLEADASTQLATLSGGQRTRAALAAAVFAAPDFLLLDEPSNHLDREGRDAVLRLMETWRGGLVIVSHDRELLGRMDAIVEITGRGATRYGGDWQHYRDRKSIELAAAEQNLAHAQKEQEAVVRKAQAADERQARHDAAGGRKAARGDLPRILLGARRNAAEATAGGGRRLIEQLASRAEEGVAAAKARVEILQQLSIVLPPTALPSGRMVLTMSGVTGGHDPDVPVITSFDFAISGPDRIAIVGPNGAGKTTLLNLISGGLVPSAGRLDVAVPMALVDQQVTFLDRDATILDNFKRLNADATENACRAALAGFLFRADAALQLVGTLSGGQLLRAGLACHLGGARPPQLLILDEPTNHLDLDSIAAVEAALQAYDGALVVVSHDEAFLGNISISRRVELGAKANPSLVGGQNR